MKLRKIVALCLSFIIVIGCFPMKAYAVDLPQYIINIEDMNWEQVDLQNVGTLDGTSSLRSSDSISGVIAAHSISVDRQPLYLPSNSAITFNCSYSPSSAVMDFGVVDSSNGFYYISTKGGSINRTIRISQAGNYMVAIRNNSSQTVRVVGFVNY